MAYTKTEWVTGETPLSADNMNNIENGIEDLNTQLESRTGEYRFSIASNVSTAQWPIAYGYYDASTQTARIYFSSRYSANVSSGTVHFTIPEPYRPIVGSPVIIMAYNDTNSVIIGSQTIDTDGKITQGLTGFCRGLIGYGEYKVGGVTE